RSAGAAPDACPACSLMPTPRRPVTAPRSVSMARLVTVCNHRSLREDADVADDESPAPSVADERDALAGLLRRLGATEEEIRKALAGTGAGDFAVELVLRAGRGPLTLAEAAAATDVTPEEFAQLWRTP